MPVGDAGSVFLQTLDSRPSARFSDECPSAGKHNSDLGVLAGLGVDLYRTLMLLDDDVVSDGQAKAGTLTRRFCREEGIEHLLLYLGRNAGAVIANSDLNFVAKVLCHRHYGWLIAIAIA